MNAATIVIFPDAHVMFRCTLQYVMAAYQSPGENVDPSVLINSVSVNAVSNTQLAPL